MQLKENILKDFKKALKAWLREMTFEGLKFRIKKWVHSYEAIVKDAVLIIFVPGSKQIDGDTIQISFLSIKRNRHTLAVFIHKRIKLAETA